MLSAIAAFFVKGGQGDMPHASQFLQDFRGWGSCENGACEGTQAVLANLVQSVRRKIASFSCIGSLSKTHKGIVAHRWKYKRLSGC